MHPSPAPDPALRALLRRADPADGLTSPPPAAFAAAVHARIRSETGLARPAPGIDSVSVTHVPRARALARQLLPLAAALALLASLGAGSAFAYAKHERERSERYVSAFARSIDPWLMHADRSTSPATPAHRH